MENEKVRSRHTFDLRGWPFLPCMNLSTQRSIKSALDPPTDCELYRSNFFRSETFILLNLSVAWSAICFSSSSKNWAMSWEGRGCICKRAFSASSPLISSICLQVLRPRPKLVFSYPFSLSSFRWAKSQAGHVPAQREGAFQVNERWGMSRE